MIGNMHSRLLTALAIVLPLTMAPALAVDNLGLFELDFDGPDSADAADNGFGNNGDDWQNIANDSDSSIEDTGIINDTLGNQDNVLTGGGTKDDNDFPLWAWKEAKATPDKNNITNAYAAAYTDSGDLIIYFGADRFANNGDAQIGFWFLQGDVEPQLDGSFSGNHQDGDILILANFLQGGVVGDVDVFEWRANAGNEGNINLFKIGTFDACDGTGKDACALTNDNDVQAFWPYSPKFGVDGFIPQNSLFEGGVNINNFLDNTPCFATFMAETRSSQSTDAVLKDFVIADFTLCGVEATKVCEADLNAAGDAVTVSFSGTVTNTGAQTLNIELTDTILDVDPANISNHQVTAVCIDGNADDACGDGTDTPVAFATPDAGQATFELLAGETVVYEGEYTVAGTIDDLNFDDQVTVIGSAGVGGDTVEASADATCMAVGTPNIAVTKFCTPSFINGDTFQAVITGGAENTGNVKLINVSLTDNVIDPGQLIVVKDTNGNGIVDGGEPAFDGMLAVGEKLAFTATLLFTDQTSHENTISASGENVFLAGDTASDSASVTANTCSITPAPNLTIMKVCDTSLGGGTGVELIQQNGVVVVQVGNIITVENTGDEDLDPVTVSDDQADLIQSAGPVFTCVGNTCTGRLDVGQTVTFTQKYLPDGNSIIGALTNPDGVSFVNEATAQGTGVLSTTDVGPVMDDAPCNLCQ